MTKKKFKKALAEVDKNIWRRLKKEANRKTQKVVPGNFSLEESLAQYENPGSIVSNMIKFNITKKGTCYWYDVSFALSANYGKENK